MATIVASRELSVVPVISTSAYSPGDQIGGIQTLEIGLCEYYLTELERLTVVDSSQQSASLTLYFFNSLPVVNSTDNQPFDVDNSELAQKLLASVTVDSGKYLTVSGASIANATFGNVNLKASPYSPGKLYCVAKINAAKTYSSTDALSLRYSFVQYGGAGGASGGSADNVTNSQLDEMSPLTIKGNNTESAAKPLDLDSEEVTAMLDAFVGANGSDGVKGLVPKPIVGDSGKFLKGDGTWGFASSSDPVRSVSSSANISASDYYLGVDSTFSAITLTLPNPATLSNGQRFCVKDETGKAGINPITVDGNGAMIDGQPTLTISCEYESREIIARGSFYAIK